MEQMPFYSVPGAAIIDQIVAESREHFLWLQQTPENLVRLENFLNERIEEEIALGNFRDTFITPANQLARFDGLAVRKDPTDPLMMRVIPVWVLVKEENNE